MDRIRSRVVLAHDDVLLRGGLDEPSNREWEVLALMAEGLSNSGIGQALLVTEGTVEKHVRGIMTKLRLPEAAHVHRRVLAVENR